MSVLEKYGIPRMRDALLKAGVHYHDYHGGNLMRDPKTGKAKLIDPGYSRVKNKPRVTRVKASNREELPYTETVTKMVTIPLIGADGSQKMVDLPLIRRTYT